MDKNRSHFLARFRGLIQAGAALLTNIHLPNFLKGTLYQGKGKYLCVPGLNCYSCPGAAGACPIGAFQAVVGSSKFRFSYYVTGILILLGVLLGRFICGFLCPFGWLQELLHKIPSPKLSTRRLKPLRYIKYAVLLIMVVLLPAVIVNTSGMGIRSSASTCVRRAYWRAQFRFLFLQTRAYELLWESCSAGNSAFCWQLW